MTEHAHNLTHNEDKNKTESCANNCHNKMGWQIGGSIIIASLIISGSILYNFKMMLNKFDISSLINSIASQNLQNQGTNPTAQQPTQQPLAPIDYKSRANEPVIGNKNAKVTVVEFADFQCPFCKKFYDDTFKELKTKFIDTGKIKYAFRHYPLPFHQNAQIAGVAAECANKQGKFWEFHDILFTKGSGDGTGLAASDLKSYGDSLGLNKGTFGFNKNQFNNCVDSSSTLETVKNDTSYGASVGVNGTPTFYINGKQLVGAQPFSAFEQAINDALK